MPFLDCSHPDSKAFGKVCPHLLTGEEDEYKQYFTGAGLTYSLICLPCAEHIQDVVSDLQTVCALCFKNIAENGFWVGIGGQPEILREPSDLIFQNRIVKVPGLAPDTLKEIQPLPCTSQSIWISVTTAGHLLQINLDSQSIVTLTTLEPSEVDLTKPVSLCFAPDGDFMAITNTLGTTGVVLDLASGRRTFQLQRGNYHSDVSPFPIAFFKHQSKTLLVHAIDWNKLHITDPATGTLLTPREFPSYDQGQRPQHYLDYFHGRLSISADQAWIVDDGWMWHPVGKIRSWSLNKWLEENIWESEHGQSEKRFSYRAYFWGGPMCWVDEHTLAVWGYGEDDEWLIPAVCLYDVISGSRVRWFAGPEVQSQKQKRLADFGGGLVFDRYLFAYSAKYGISVWDVAKGACLLVDETFFPIRYHAGTQEFLSFNSDGAFQLSRLIKSSKMSA